MIYRLSCISFDSYIKPQLFRLDGTWQERCISFDSYIKPQLVSRHHHGEPVVYLLIPTSNHNRWANYKRIGGLYIF